MTIAPGSEPGRTTRPYQPYACAKAAGPIAQPTALHSQPTVLRGWRATMIAPTVG